MRSFLQPMGATTSVARPRHGCVDPIVKFGYVREMPRPTIKTTTSCPECERPLGRLGRGDARLGKTAKVLFVVAAIATAIWAGIVLVWSPVFLVPRGLGGIAICVVFYMWPGLLLGGIATQLPRIRTLRCSRCGWSQTTTLRS
jgi:hypothetical protein